MVTDEDLQRLREGYEAFNERDFETVIDRISLDIEISDRAEVPDPQSYSGRDQVLEQFKAVSEEFDDYRLDVLELIPSGDYIVVVLRQSGRGRLSGVPVEGELCHVWEVEDGRTIGMRAFTSREEALAAAS